MSNFEHEIVPLSGGTDDEEVDAGGDEEITSSPPLLPHSDMMADFLIVMHGQPITQPGFLAYLATEGTV